MTTEPLKRDGEEGFTILEMVVAMTILALVLGIASQSIVLASRSVAIAQEKVEEARQLRALMANYDAGIQSTDDLGGQAGSGWILRAVPIDVARSGMTAVILERRDASGRRGSSFLTFVPDGSVGKR